MDWRACIPPEQDRPPVLTSASHRIRDPFVRCERRSTRYPEPSVWGRPRCMGQVLGNAAARAPMWPTKTFLKATVSAAFRRSCCSSSLAAALPGLGRRRGRLTGGEIAGLREGSRRTHKGRGRPQPAEPSGHLRHRRYRLVLDEQASPCLAWPPSNRAPISPRRSVVCCAVSAARRRSATGMSAAGRRRSVGARLSPISAG
jgi:hypothetical protein